MANVSSRFIALGLRRSYTLAVKNAQMRNMVSLLKVAGVLLIVYAVVCFMVNFGLWHPLVVGDIVTLWNPLRLVTPAIPILEDVLNVVFAVIWSFAMFLIGLILLK